MALGKDTATIDYRANVTLRKLYNLWPNHTICAEGFALQCFSLKGVSPYIRAKFRMLLNKGNISREHSERIQFATTQNAR